jgi:phosphoglycolate phosphatase
LVTIRCKTQLFDPVQAVIFDKDGTLANAEEFLRNLAQRRARLIDAQIPGVQEPLLMAFGIEGDRINPAGLMAVGTRLENEIAAAAYVAETGRDWVASLQLVRSAFEEADKYRSKKAEQTPLNPGALALIQQLTQAGIKLAILSSDSAANVREFVETHELQPYFPALYGVDERYLAKSDPELIQQVLTDLAVAPEQILMVGDSQVDVQIAHDTAMAGCIGFTGGWVSNNLRKLR